MQSETVLCLQPASESVSWFGVAHRCVYLPNIYKNVSQILQVCKSHKFGFPASLERFRRSGSNGLPLLCGNICPELISCCPLWMPMPSSLPQSLLFPITPTVEISCLISHLQFFSYTGSNLLILYTPGRNLSLQFLDYISVGSHCLL